MTNFFIVGQTIVIIFEPVGPYS